MNVSTRKLMLKLNRGVYFLDKYLATSEKEYIKYAKENFDEYLKMTESIDCPQEFKMYFKTKDTIDRFFQSEMES